jgi:hypothetical protein
MMTKWVLALVAAVALIVAPQGAISGERVKVEFEKVKTDAPSGLEYDYTFMVKNHHSGDAIEDADFMISTDMPAMPGAHHMPHVKAEPGHHPGSYKARLDFDMAGEWTLTLKFSQPHKDQVVISDMVGEQAGETEMDHSNHGDDGTDHSNHGQSDQ